MLYQIQNAGLDSVVEGANEISADHFGARYGSFRSEDRFFDQVEDFDGGLIVWPGGSLAERSVDRYGFEHDGLYNSAEYGDRPGIEEMMSYAVENDKALSVVLPSSRYVGEDDLLRAEINEFLADLLGGEYGELPRKMIFEIGNEYYANYDGANEVEKAAAYGKIANIYGEEIARVDEIVGGLPENIEFSFQAGRSAEANQAIIDEMGEDALSMVDMVSHHRFSARIEGADRHIDELEASLDQWSDAVEASGEEAPGLYLSAYNAASLSREEALDKYIESLGDEGKGLSREDFDLEGRSDEDFEEFYQSMLDDRPHGIEHAELLLEMYSQYSGLGVEAAGVYGWDMVHSGRSSLEGADGESYVFAGGAMQDMMAESLVGARVLDWYQDQDNVGNDANEDASAVYGFESEDKLVMFLSNPNVSGDPFEVRINLDDLGINIEHVWGERLVAEAPEDWQNLFGVAESPNVDQSAEEESFAVAIRSAFDPQIEDGQLVIKVEQDQIVRLSFAKNEAGFHEIAGWHDGMGVEIIDEDMIEQAPSIDDLIPSVEDQWFDDEEDEMQEDGEAEASERSGLGDLFDDLDLSSALLAIGLAFFGIF